MDMTISLNFLVRLSRSNSELIFVINMFVIFFISCISESHYHYFFCLKVVQMFNKNSTLSIPSFPKKYSS